MKQQWFSRQEIAKTLGVGSTTVKQLVKIGQLPKSRKILGCARWHRADVLALLDRLRREDISNTPTPAPRRRPG